MSRFCKVLMIAGMLLSASGCIISPIVEQINSCISQTPISLNSKRHKAMPCTSTMIAPLATLSNAIC